MDEWTDGWMDELIDGWIKKEKILFDFRLLCPKVKTTNINRVLNITYFPLMLFR